MGKYSAKGLYAGYDKNNKEREALDYYATPPQEVTNILNKMKLNLVGKTVLDPGCGEGHLLKGVRDYEADSYLLGTDIKDRTGAVTHLLKEEGNIFFKYGEKYDFLSEDYLFSDVHYVIMNPPYSVLIPFIQHSLSIATEGVLMLGRLQALEGVKRYETIFRDYPPTKVFVYVDRIACYKNGDFSLPPNSIQAYAWFYWDKKDTSKITTLDFIRKIR